MNNKKTIMSFSALLILIFHLWINVSNTSLELVLRQLCVIGVDIFFFISIYGCSKKKIKYKEFIKNRFINVYLKFLILSIVFAIISSWSIKKVILTCLGIDLFLSGGGSFLWFLPGIMIVYLLIPLYKKCDENNTFLTLLLTIIFYLLLSILISCFTNYKEIFILLNRVPIMLLAFYISKYEIIDKLNKSNKLYWITAGIIFIVGFILSYYSTINRIKVGWLYDIFYIINILLEIGVILIVNKIKDNSITILIGSATLEMYALQMMFGFKIVNKLYLLINNKLLTNICTIIIFIILSIILKYIFDFIYKKIIKI